jgi:hypothetical protein
MLNISIPKIVVNATSHSPSMVSLMCRPITCVTAHVSLHRGDGYCSDIYKGDGQGMVTATKRAIATATRAEGDKEGNEDGGKSNHDGNKEGNHKGGKGDGNG